MRPTMASTSFDGNMQKTSVIHKVMLYCIFFNLDIFFTVEAPLMNHNWKLYSAISNTHVLYNSYF